MSGFPTPPGFTPSPHPGDESHPSSPKVTLDEVSYILKSTLKPQHHDNPQVLAFINEYLLCRDARQSAKTLGLKPSIGVHMRNQPDIFAAISKITEKAVMKYGYDAAELVEKVKEIAFIDPGELERPDGSFVESLRELSPEVRRAIKSLKVKNEYGEDPNGMKVVTGKILEFTFWDKMKAVELLGTEKYLFKSTHRVEHDLGRNMAETLLESRKRADERVLEMKARDVGP